MNFFFKFQSQTIVFFFLHINLNYGYGLHYHVEENKLTRTRFVSTSFLSLTDHSQVGVGAPAIGMLTLIGSPARTLIFLPMRLSKNILGFSEIHRFKLALNGKTYEKLQMKNQINIF